ncbi:MAG: tRNA preQ1(34) S-adenosylmethionine ribosyltransferase-isomerase QueA [Verrucomicrobiae bacterium]|nr:tRNA preQ1(34) S-adenosylmethionine ribosyltransferase-isomerase QueA [Verrucomicrobiae bacterium]
MSPTEFKTADFDYHLPAELIAQEPLADRTAARMMVVDRNTGTVQHDIVRHLPRYVRDGDLLVLNDTRVIPARLWAARPRVELLLVEQLDSRRWTAMVKPGRRAQPGTTLEFADGTCVRVTETTPTGLRILEFHEDPQRLIEQHGEMPLPPYIRRPATETDRQRYQTVFARHAGAVAAPTAGLHFTPELLAQVPHTFITLHVGPGTFRPVKTEDPAQHHLDAERFEVSEEAAAAMRAAKRIWAVGTTVVRTLETLGEPRAASGRTDLYILPGFQFRMVKALLTNFHLPRSTLLMLVCAFGGRELILRAYEEAVRERYRFYSYGDCMLIL